MSRWAACAITPLPLLDSFAITSRRESRRPHSGARPMSGTQLAAEGRRAVVRALRRRVAELETSAFETLCALLLEKMGMRDVRVAKRSKL